MEQTPGKIPIKRITAIDLGTNSFHAIIVDIFSDGSFYIIDRLKEMVLLSEKGFDNKLSPQAIERGLNALKRIKTLSDHQNSSKILANATSAIREAENGGEFIQKVIDEIGIKINAIPGRVEAELIGLAVRHGIEMPDKPSLIMDIGGGSVEFLLGDKNVFYHVSSKKLGVARMTASLVDNDPITDEEIEKLIHHYKENLVDVAQAFAMNRASLLIGSSGTMQNIALMISARKKMSPSLSINELEFSSIDFFEFYDDVIKMNSKERSDLTGLDEKRIDIIVPGLVLVRYVLKTFGIEKVKISSQALREGIILRYIKKEMSDLQLKNGSYSPRLRSVMELVNKYDWHEAHSSHVAQLSLTLFDEFRDQLQLSDDDRDLLHFAALMHDIGYFISHKKHHKHALYIIRNSALMGFKEYEIELMANVARYHRRSTPKMRHSYFKALSKEQRGRVKKLSGILRVADGLDRSHYQNVRSLDVVKQNSKVKIIIQTEADPQLEIWGAMRKRTLLEDVLGADVEVIYQK
ncbi:MAG: Ppx/GppA phosphatase family protein [Balneolaceae bacterium]